MKTTFRKFGALSMAFLAAVQPMLATAASYELRKPVPKFQVEPSAPSVETPASPAPSTAAALQASTTSLVFPASAVGSTVVRTVQVQNSGSASGNVQVTVSGAPYSVAHNCGLLAVGATCDVNVSFKPTAGGNYPGELTVSSGASIVKVGLDGTGQGASVVVSPSSVNFGTVTVGDSGTAQLTLSNGGNGPAALSFGAVAAPVAVSANSTCASVLNAGASCTVDFAYTPTSASTLAQTFVITVDGKSTSVPLSGTSVAVPLATLSTTTLSFGMVPMGSQVARTVRLTNTGSALLSLTAAPALAGNAGYSFASPGGTTCGASLAPGAYCDTTVVFSPLSAQGPFNGTLSFETNAAGSAATVALSASAVTNTATFEPTSGSSTSFGTVVVGAPVSRSFVFNNTGGATLTGVYATLSAATGLSITANSCGTDATRASVSVGGACYITVQYAPTQAATLSGVTLTVNSSASNSPHVLSLSGAAVVASFDVSTSSLSGFSALVGGTSTAQGVLVLNTGEAPVQIQTVTASSPFTASLVNCPLNTNIPQGGCTVNVAYSPVAVESNRTGSVVVTTSAGSKTVTLSGATSAQVAVTGALTGSTTGTAASTLSVVAPAGYALSTATAVQLRSGASVVATSSTVSYDAATRTLSSSFEGVSLPAAGTYTVSVREGSQQLATGSFTLTAPVTISVTDTSNIALTSLAFGTVSASTTKTFRLANAATSTGPLTVTGIAALGANTPFAVTAVTVTAGNTGATCTSASNMVIPVGKSCDVTVMVQNVPGNYGAGFGLQVTTSGAQVVNPAALGTGTQFTLPVTAVVSNNTGVYLNFEGTNLETDTSDSNVPVSIVGAVTRNTSTARSGLASANIASNGYLDVATANSAFGYGTGDFTVEGWVNLASLTGTFVDHRVSASTDARHVIDFTGTGNVRVWTGGTLRLTSATAVALNTWTHIALVRKGTTVNLYLNGATQGAWAEGSDLGASNRLRIGNNFNATAGLSGKVDEFKVTRGVALYSGNFTLPQPAISAPTVVTPADTAQGSTSAATTVTVSNTGNHPMLMGAITATTNFGITANNCTGVSVSAGTTCTFGVVLSPTTTGQLSGTVTVNHSAATGTLSIAAGGTGLTSTGADPHWASVSTLVRGDGPHGTDAILDNKGALTFALVGTGTTPYVSSADSKFGGTSMYFTGQQYLQATTATTLGTGNFTVEFWAKRANTSGRPVGTDGWWVGTKYQNAGEGYNGVVLTHCGVIAGGESWCGFDSASIGFGMTTAQMANWNYVAMTRTGNILRLYVNGELKATQDMVSAYSANKTVNRIEIGNGWQGFIDDLRVTSGVSRYGTATSIPVPTAAWPMTGNLVVPSTQNLAFTASAVGVPSATRNVTLTNYGSSAATISGISVTSGTTAFAQSNNCGSSLAAGASCTITVSAVPIAVGTNTGSISVTMSNTNRTSQVINLSVTGTAADVAWMQFDGADNGTSFTDQTGLTVTRNGGAVTSTTQYKQGSASLYLPGANDFVSVPNNGGADLGSPDFTVEAWVYPTTASTAATIAATQQWSAGYKGGWQLQFTNNTVTFRNNNASVVTSAANSVPLNAWTHIAVTRTGGSNYVLYVNGVSVATAANATAVSRPTGVSSQDLRIGAVISDGNISQRFYGYLDNVRVTNGTARYTANFEPRPAVAASTTALSFGTTDVKTAPVPRTVTVTNNGALAVSGMSAAVTTLATDYSVSGSCPAVLAPAQSCTFTVTFNPQAGGTRSGTLTVTTGGNPSTIAVSLSGSGTASASDSNFANVATLAHLDGNTQEISGKDTIGPVNVSYGEGRFGTAAVLNGTNAYLTGTSLYALSTTNNWTVEMWIRPDQVTSAMGLLNQYGASDMNWTWAINNATTMSFAGTTFTLASPLVAGSWHHVALVRASGVTYVYVNGVRATGSTSASVSLYGTAYRIGTSWGVSGANSLFKGAIDEVRITGGLARYTTTPFTVPTAAFPNW